MAHPADTMARQLGELTLALVQIPSVTGDERALAEWLHGWAVRQAGADDVLRHQDNLIVGGPDGQRPCVALVGHLDTVPPSPGGTPPTATDTEIIGRGTSDMKGGLAVMVKLYEALDLPRLPFSLLLAFYSGEEGPYAESGLGQLLNRFDLLHEVDLAILLEPTHNTLQLGCLGALHASLTFHGTAAHSARPWEGENAIHKAAPLLSRLNRLPPREVELDGLLFRETMSITQAQGGIARNVVPDRFKLNLNYRFAPGDRNTDATAAARAMVLSLAPEAEIEITDVAPPGPVPLDNPIVAHLVRHAQPTIGAKEAWTDVGRLAASGIDAVNFGPGDPSCAHQATERITLTALAHSFETLRRVLQAPLARDP